MNYRNYFLLGFLSVAMASGVGAQVARRKGPIVRQVDRRQVAAVGEDTFAEQASRLSRLAERRHLGRAG